MSRSTQWLSLVAGGLLFVYGIIKLVQAGELTLLILSVLIIAFTVSNMLRSREKK